MDINTLRSVMTALCFVAFSGIVIWAWSGRNKARMDEAAQMPFNEEEIDGERR